jgi:hypothetical protein
MATPAPSLVPSAFRDGKKLIVPRLAGFPANCLKCGAQAEKPWRKKFYWHPAWLYILVLFPGIVIYAVVAMVARKNIALALPLCEVHHGERRRYQIIGAILCLFCIPAGFFLEGAIKISSDASIGIAVLMLMAGLVFLMISGQTIRATLIDETHAEFSGAGKPFLDLLMEKPLG